MDDDSVPTSERPLDGITTQCATLRAPTEFVVRYGPAVRGYLERL
jgi:hypothetical protein